MALTDGLVSYYKLDGTSGDVVDETGANDGTNVGATRGGAGIIEKSFSFDGTNDYVNLGDIAWIDAVKELSISLWIKIPSGVAGTGYIFGKTGGNYSDDQVFRSKITEDGQIEFSKRSVNNVTTGTELTSAISTDVWHNIIYVVDATNISIYIDGLLAESVANADYDYFNPNANILALGRWGSYDGAYLEGNLDEIGIWNRALTEKERLGLYNEGNGIAYPLEFYLKENSSGKLKIGGDLFGTKKNNLFTKRTASGETAIKSGNQTIQKLIDVNSSFNSSTGVKTKTTTTYTTLISQYHKSNTGKVHIIANAPVVVTTSNGDISVRLTKNGVLIPGAEILNLWSSGDGCISFTLTGFPETEKGEKALYALQWKQGYAELDFDAGGDWGAYNIFIQDII